MTSMNSPISQREARSKWPKHLVAQEKPPILIRPYTKPEHS